MMKSRTKNSSTGIRSLKRRFFSTPLNIVISVICLWIMAYLFWKILNWAVLSAVFTDEGGAAACKGASGACWSVIADRWRIIMFGLYPYAEQWRSALACIVVVLIIVLSCLPSFWTGKRIAMVWVGGVVCFYILMAGGVFGLAKVGEEMWGGLALTLFIFITTCLLGFPLSIILALMRNSDMPWISHIVGVIIDAVRSLPLISILFTFAIVLPFMLPNWLQGEKLYRVIIGFALFFAAYQAEIVRGGMQGVAAGQDEAAKALGLDYWHRISRITLPQAMRNALPATINQFVISFKETSLVVIIGFFEILASANAAYGTGEWTFAYVEVYVFVAFIYFIFVFSLSRYGAFLERRMEVGHQ